jgi:hypothetical protein
MEEMLIEKWAYRKEEWKTQNQKECRERKTRNKMRNYEI